MLCLHFTIQQIKKDFAFWRATVPLIFILITPQYHSTTMEKNLPKVKGFNRFYEVDKVKSPKEQLKILKEVFADMVVSGGNEEGTMPH
jgi:hypothetical protein